MTSESNNKYEDFDDVLGSGTLLKKVIEPGEHRGDPNVEAPRKFFAVIDIETKLEKSDTIIKTESFKDYLISTEADLFSGAQIVLPLMKTGEVSRYILDPKFCYGSEGNPPHIPPNSKLDCTIKLLSFIPHEEFISCHLLDAELFPLEMRDKIAIRKKERGNFWFARNDFKYALLAYKSAIILLNESKDESCLVALRNNLAACYIKLDELNKARKQIEKALKIDPKNVKALFRRATIEMSCGQSKDACETLLLILQIDPTNKAVSTMLVQAKHKAETEFQQERGLYKRMFQS